MLLLLLFSLHHFFVVVVVVVVFLVHYPLTFNRRMNSIFFLERQPWERLDWKTVACCYCIPHKTTHPSWACFCFRSRGNRYIKWRMICVFIEPGLDVFTIGRSIIMKKYFFSKLSMISFYILCCTRSHNRVTIALLFLLFAEQTTVVENTGHSTYRCFHSEPQKNM